MSYTFLTIPPEIRDIILEYSLLSSRPPPKDIAAATPTRQEPVQNWQWHKPPFMTWSPGPYRVAFEKPNQYIWPTQALQLVNHQLYDETRAAMSRLGDQAGYTLDVLFVNESQFWPTWIRVPQFTRQVKEVNVTFRIFGNANAHAKLYERSAFLHGNAEPPPIHWGLYYLLEHFLKRGPTLSSPPDSSWDADICLQVLNINIVAGEGQQPHPWDQERVWMEQQERQTLPDPDDTRIMNPLWLANIMFSQILYLLSMTYHSSEYGAVIHERVGVIHISVEGEHTHSIDIASVLAKLSHNVPSDTFGHVPPEIRSSAFWAWKRATIQRRIERGLPPVFNSVEEPRSYSDDRESQTNTDTPLLSMTTIKLITNRLFKSTIFRKNSKSA